jgi:hypothetical protein
MASPLAVERHDRSVGDDNASHHRETEGHPVSSGRPIMPIPNLWPDGKSKNLSRALNNIALHRLCPDLGEVKNGTLVPASHVREFFPSTKLGATEPVMLFLQARKGDHYIMLHEDWVETLTQSAASGSEAALLALSCSPDTPAGPVHTWLIPASVVQEMGDALPKLAPGDKANLRNVRINRDRQTGRWTWTGAHANGAVDVHEYYTPWTDLTPDELAHIRDGIDGKLPGLGDDEPPAEVGVAPVQPPERPVDVEAPAADKTEPTTINNVLFFGPPGVGKSWHVDQLCGGQNGSTAGTTYRVTFHPEYSYTDFVGTYRPVMAFGRGQPYVREDGRALPAGRPAVAYEFVPGPFTRALVEALRDPGRLVYLVIEEINRGNCAAIFGDVFQLLDRSAEPGAWRGSSRYPITVDAAWGQHVQSSGITAAAAERMRTRGLFIPGNLVLLATMNTSDQSLFPLDSAFKRRWQMRYIPIEYDQATGRRVAVVGGETPVFVTWADFLREMNRRIARELRSDDKQMGQWFVSDAEVEPDVFRDKVLFYLWSDVFRHSPGVVFGEDIDTYDTLVREFDDGTWVFDQAFADSLKISEELGLSGAPEAAPLADAVAPAEGA